MRKIPILLAADVALITFLVLGWTNRLPSWEPALAKITSLLPPQLSKIIAPTGKEASPPASPSTKSSFRPLTDLQALAEENYQLAQKLQEAQTKIKQLEEQLRSYQNPKQITVPPSYNYTGEDLFAEVNRYRRENNLGELAKDYNLCYLASYRLNQLLEAGKLDNHQGFEDFKPAEKFKYELVGENLAQGYQTAYDTVYQGWVSSPGHHLLLSDLRLTLGCTATNRGIAVLVAGKEH